MIHLIVNTAIDDFYGHYCDDGLYIVKRYLCNSAVVPKKYKSTKNKKQITCTNCLKILGILK